MLTRKDFNELATIIGTHEARMSGMSYSGEDLIALREDMMNFCRRRNSRFDSSKFQEAIGDARNAAS